MKVFNLMCKVVSNELELVSLLMMLWTNCFPPFSALCNYNQLSVLQILCTAIAVLLQYFFLVSFFLMLAEGITIAVSVILVFWTNSKVKVLLPLAWGEYHTQHLQIHLSNFVYLVVKDYKNICRARNMHHFFFSRVTSALNK